jgi:hypothetical protein
VAGDIKPYKFTVEDGMFIETRQTLLDLDPQTVYRSCTQAKPWARLARPWLGWLPLERPCWFGPELRWRGGASSRGENKIQPNRQQIPHCKLPLKNSKHPTAPQRNFR